MFRLCGNVSSGDVYKRQLVKSGAEGMQMFLPAIVFLIGCLLAFATGTSWGTFGVLIPITLSLIHICCG